VRVAAARTEWAIWQETAPYSVGLEEEVMLLCPADWSLAQRIGDVLSALPEDVSRSVGTETHQGVLELSTGPHTRVGAAAAELRSLRRRLAEALEPMGIRLAAAGTHPTTTWEETLVSPASRHQLIHQTMGELARREPTFALHVHVGVTDPDAAIELMGRLRTHLPLLLALSANSPYWQGRDARLASTRTALFQAFPRTGIPRRHDTYEDWVQTVEVLVESGALPEPTFLWWDIRPQPRFGTVEVRIMDAQTTVTRSAALAALVQSTARLELEEGYASETLMAADEVLAENRFIAARDGIEARLIDPEARCRRPARELVEELLDAARPHAEALGCLRQLAQLETLVDAPGAAFQRRSAAEHGPVGLTAALSDAFSE